MQPVMEPPYTSDCWGCDTTSDGADLQADAIIDGAAPQPNATSDVPPYNQLYNQIQLVMGSLYNQMQIVIEPTYTQMQPVMGRLTSRCN